MKHAGSNRSTVRQRRAGSHRRCVAAMLLLCGAALPGCENPGDDWSQDHSNHRPIPPSKAGTRSDASPQGTNASPSRAAPGHDGAPTEPASSQAGELFHLGLASGADAAAPDPADASRPRIALKNLTARQCGRILAMLYPPFIPGGSRDSYFLVFDDNALFQSARAFVPVLDAGGGASSSVFTAAVSSLAALLQGAPDSEREIESCQDRFRRAAAAASLDARQRWAAAMLAGRIASDFRFDEAAARQSFQDAEKLALPGSMERLIAAWATARSFKESGLAAQYTDACRRITQVYSDLGRSPVYQLARQATASAQ